MPAPPPQKKLLLLLLLRLMVFVCFDNILYVKQNNLTGLTPYPICTMADYGHLPKSYLISYSNNISSLNCTHFKPTARKLKQQSASLEPYKTPFNTTIKSSNSGQSQVRCQERRTARMLGTDILTAWKWNVSRVVQMVLNCDGTFCEFSLLPLCSSDLGSAFRAARAVLWQGTSGYEVF